MATDKAIKGIAFDLQDAQTAADFRRIAKRCDDLAKPLVIRKHEIETTLGNLQALRVEADYQLKRSTK